MTEVPALIREIPDEAAAPMALIENIQRENLNPLEEAQGLQRLINEFSMTHEQAADAVGRSRPAASNLLRLLKLVPPVQELLMSGEIDMGHARALLPLSGDLQIQLAQRVVHKGLSVRETERLAQNASKLPKQQTETNAPDRDVLRLQEELTDILGARVEIRANKKGTGKIQIQFGDLDQLDGILQRFR
jgi:ParB family chromosome partitioning protein